PVADREDPAVARQRVAVAVPNIEAGLDPRVIMQWALVVGADRHALRVAAIACGSERSTEPGVGTVGDDDVAGPDLPGRPGCLVLDHGAVDEAAFEDRSDCFGGLVGLGARRRGVGEDDLVEIPSPD